MNFKVGDVVQVTKDYPNDSTAIKGERYLIESLNYYGEAVLHYYNKFESGRIVAPCVSTRFLIKRNVVPILTF